MQDIAFVGLGAMGLPMASRLASAGYRVRGFDKRPEAGAALAAQGAQACADVAQAATGASALVLMVVNMAQARGVLFEAGALDALAPGAAVLLTATCPPAEVEALAGEVAAAGRHLVDCPVSGGVVGANAGSLTIMAAAPEPVFREVRPILAAMGERIFHVGERPGQGASVKTVNQLLCGVHIAAAAEALALGERMGVDTAVLLDILGSSAAGSWMLRDRGPRMREAEPPVTSAVDIFVKDLGIVLQAGETARADLPLAGAAHALFRAASEAGDGRRDDSQVIRVYREHEPGTSN